mmetsp:Transcript_15428/g.26338  ORF Transcript_15428/g.26338 Transcript_15428/m.26338 type:complete len:92 (-) Transcript_15428:176-451(-)
MMIHIMSIRGRRDWWRRGSTQRRSGGRNHGRGIKNINDYNQFCNSFQGIKLMTVERGRGVVFIGIIGCLSFANIISDEIMQCMSEFKNEVA